MRSIVSADARRLLQELAEDRALVALDFDGTLAPIVPDRDAAQLRPETRALLRTLALLYPCAVVSGRARSDVAARLTGIQLAAIVGNHGAEAGQGPLDRSRRARLLAWKRAIEEGLRGQEGIALEDKRFTLAVHYRAAPSRAEARHAVLRVANRLDGARVFGGHAVVNVVPDDAPHKGTAVREVLRRVGSRPVLYVGDDRTDEDVFAEPCVTVAVRVGRTARSLARWYVPGQRGVDELLRRLIEARVRADGEDLTADALAVVVGT